MLLFIDPTDAKINVLALVTPKKVHWFRFGADQTSEILMLRIKDFLARLRVGFENIKKIAIVVGPGPFSKIRTGVALANALSYALGIKLVAVKKESVPLNLTVLLGRTGQKLVRPFYGKSPHITKPRKR